MGICSVDWPWCEPSPSSRSKCSPQARLRSGMDAVMVYSYHPCNRPAPALCHDGHDFAHRHFARDPPPGTWFAKVHELQARFGISDAVIPAGASAPRKKRALRKYKQECVILVVLQGLGCSGTEDALPWPWIALSLSDGARKRRFYVWWSCRCLGYVPGLDVGCRGCGSVIDAAVTHMRTCQMLCQFGNATDRDEAVGKLFAQPRGPEDFLSKIDLFADALAFTDA